MATKKKTKTKKPAKKKAAKAKKKAKKASKKLGPRRDKAEKSKIVAAYKAAADRGGKKAVLEKFGVAQSSVHYWQSAGL